MIGAVFYSGKLMDTRYLQHLQKVILDFVPKLHLFNLRNFGFQNDGVPSYKTSAKKAALY